MPIEGGFDISDTINVLLGNIPGVQDGESVFDFKSRVNADIATIVVAIATKLSETDAFIEKHSDDKRAEREQFYSAAERRFVGNDGG